VNKGKVKVGVVGCGYIAQNTHMPIYKKINQATVVAVCDRDLELAEKAATKFSIPKVYSDLQAMLEHEPLDMVDICTPINTHATLAIQAMEAGCHVLTEKPMAINSAEADEMIAVAKRKQVKLSVMHNMLFLPTVRRMRSLVDRHVVGDLIRVDIKLSHPPWDFPAIADPGHWWHRLPGGVFGDSLPHVLYLAREFLGAIEPLTVQTYKLGSYSHLGIDEVEILLKGQKGTGSIVVSCNWPSLCEINIHGTKMNIHGNLNNSFVVTYRGKTNSGRGIATLYARENLSRSLQILSSSLSTGWVMLKGQHKGHPVQIVKFIESIQRDTTPAVTGEDHREILELWEKITGKIDSQALSFRKCLAE
jgi:predicted dehydrogenase